MKRIALVLLASAAALAANSARADHMDVRGSINFGGPAYVAPGYGYGYGYGNGYWQDVSTRVLVPGHWETSYDAYGRAFNRWEPPHYELQTRRVWIDRDRDHDRWDHERWEHMRHEREEHEEHEEREHRFGGWGR